MKRSRMQLRLRPSNKMTAMARDTNPDEHDFIRLGAAARKYFQPSGDVVRVFTAAGAECFLQVKQAYMQDLQNADAAGRCGFVTKGTYDTVTKGSGEALIWVSESEHALMLGSDPEFGLMGPDGIIKYASKVVAYGKNADLGTDGPSMEIRPVPANSVEGHVDNIRALMMKGVGDAQINKDKWFTGAMVKCPVAKRVYVFGGHIHVGDPAALMSYVRKTEGLKVEDVHRRLIRLLDDLVGLPLTRIDGPFAGERRFGKGSNNFGFFGDFRRQTNRFEWRTPSAVWLTDPVLARAVLGTVKAVTEHAYTLLLENKFDPAWIRATSTRKSLLKAMGASSDAQVRDTLHKSAPALVDKDTMKGYHDRLRALSTYEEYKEYVDLFIALTSIDPSKLSETIDYTGAKEAWAGEKSAVAL